MGNYMKLQYSPNPGYLNYPIPVVFVKVADINVDDVVTNNNRGPVYWFKCRF
jgi:hypothetical protein